MNFEKIGLSGLVRLRPKAWQESTPGQWVQADDVWRVESASRADGIRLYNTRSGTRIRLHEDNVHHYISDPNSASAEKNGFVNLHVKVLVTASNGSIIEPLSASEKSQGTSFSPAIQPEALERLLKEAANSQSELLLLRKQLSPRVIDNDKFLEALHGHPPGRVEIMFVKDDADSFNLSLQIRELLRKAAWEAMEPIPIPEISSQVPSAMAVGGQPIGVAIVANQITLQEAQSIFPHQPTKEWIKTPWTILSRAFMAGLGGVSGGPAAGIALPAGTTRIVVAPKHG